MKFWLKNWYRVGIVLAAILSIWLVVAPPHNRIQFFLMLNLLFLFAHQFEEYQLPGGAPLIINQVVYNETTLVDRYPGNSLSIMLVNTIAWAIYLIAIIIPKVTWLGLGVILFSLFQILGHCLEMPVKLRTWYNPGMLTTIFLFIPLGWVYIRYLASHHLLASTTWWAAGSMLVICIILSIVAPVQLLKDKNTSYIISRWQAKRYHCILQHCSFK